MGGRAALQGDACQFLNHEDAGLVLQCVASTDGCFAHGQLFLVEAGIGGVEETVGVAHLGDGARLRHARHVGRGIGMEAVAINGGDRVTVIVACGSHRHPRAVTRVTGVGGDDRAVGRGEFADHDAGARLGHALGILGVAVHTESHHQDGKKDRLFHIFSCKFLVLSF